MLRIPTVIWRDFSSPFQKAATQRDFFLVGMKEAAAVWCMCWWRQKTDASWQRAHARGGGAHSHAHFNTEETMPTTYTNDKHTPTDEIELHVETIEEVIAPGLSLNHNETLEVD
jgi:hypothetical protein